MDSKKLVCLCEIWICVTRVCCLCWVEMWITVYRFSWLEYVSRVRMVSKMQKTRSHEDWAQPGRCHSVSMPTFLEGRKKIKDLTDWWNKTKQKKWFTKLDQKSIIQLLIHKKCTRYGKDVFLVLSSLVARFGFQPIKQMGYPDHGCCGGGDPLPVKKSAIHQSSSPFRSRMWVTESYRTHAEFVTNFFCRKELFLMWTSARDTLILITDYIQILDIVILLRLCIVMRCR